MTISRGQMKRQLYMGGGIMSLSKEGIGGGDYKGIDMGSRTGFGVLEKAKDLGKKAVKGITSIAKSDAGKLALAGAALYGLGGAKFLGGEGIFKAGQGLQRFRNFANLPSAIGGLFTGVQNVDTGDLSIVKGKFSTSPIGEFLKTKTGKFAALGGLSAFLTTQFGMTDQQKEEVLKDPTQLKSYLRLYYTNLNPKAGAEEIEEFVTTNTAEYAVGGRVNKAMGDTASDNAMQAAGIEGLPIRQNPRGVKELDLRETGGFIQPVGIKEKADDIPAMLSNNEFVFTADAVRGAGDGNVELGAQRMYDTMKRLEAGGRA